MELGHLAGKRVLRADVVAAVDLFAHRIENEVGLPAEHAHAEAAERVDVLCCVEIPHARPGPLTTIW